MFNLEMSWDEMFAIANNNAQKAIYESIIAPICNEFARIRDIDPTFRFDMYLRDEVGMSATEETTLNYLSWVENFEDYVLFVYGAAVQAYQKHNSCNFETLVNSDAEIVGKFRETFGSFWRHNMSAPISSSFFWENEEAVKVLSRKNEMKLVFTGASMAVIEEAKNLHEWLTSCPVKYEPESEEELEKTRNILNSLYGDIFKEEKPAV